MKRFRFSLETLLTLRKEKEQECEIALASAVGELSSIDRRIAEARRHSEEVFMAGGRSLEDMRNREAVMRRASTVIESLQEPRELASGKVDVARHAYNEAHSQRAALDRLREKRREQWKADVRREEIRQLDETAKGALVRKRLTGGDE